MSVLSNIIEKHRVYDDQKEFLIDDNGEKLSLFKAKFNDFISCLDDIQKEIDELKKDIDGK